MRGMIIVRNPVPFWSTVFVGMVLFILWRIFFDVRPRTYQDNLLLLTCGLIALVSIACVLTFL